MNPLIFLLTLGCGIAWLFFVREVARALAPRENRGLAQLGDVADVADIIGESEQPALITTRYIRIRLLTMQIRQAAIGVFLLWLPWSSVFVAVDVVLGRHANVPMALGYGLLVSVLPFCYAADILGLLRECVTSNRSNLALAFFFCALSKTQSRGGPTDYVAVTQLLEKWLVESGKTGRAREAHLLEYVLDGPRGNTAAEITGIKNRSNVGIDSAAEVRALFKAKERAHALGRRAISR